MSKLIQVAATMLEQQQKGVLDSVNIMKNWAEYIIEDVENSKDEEAAIKILENLRNINYYSYEV